MFDISGEYLCTRFLEGSLAFVSVTLKARLQPGDSTCRSSQLCGTACSQSRALRSKQTSGKTGMPKSGEVIKSILVRRIVRNGVRAC